MPGQCAMIRSVMCRQRGLPDPANGAKERIKRFYNLTHLPFKYAYSLPLLVISFRDGKI